MINIILGAGVGLAAVFALKKIIDRKKNGQYISCGCDCASCPYGRTCK